MGGFTLAWRRTNFSLPVLAGLSLHWATGLTDSVGQVEEDDEIELEKCEVKMGEHFTAVIGADHHCIQQLNLRTRNSCSIEETTRQLTLNSLPFESPD